MLTRMGTGLLTVSIVAALALMPVRCSYSAELARADAAKEVCLEFDCDPSEIVGNQAYYKDAVDTIDTWLWVIGAL